MTNASKNNAPLNPEENALLEFLLETDNKVILVLTEDVHPESQTVLQTVRAFHKGKPHLDLIEGRYSTYQRFAQTQDAYGFPSVLIFEKGELQGLLLGSIEEEDLNELEIID